MERWNFAVAHAFKGSRFEDGTLDVEVVDWLSAYREIVLDVAKALWWTECGGTRQRLPRGFDEAFQLRLCRLERGSAVATLERSVRAGEQLTLPGHGDVFDRAMRLVEESVRAAGRGGPVPEGFPRGSLAKFRRWGRSFRDDESIEIRDDRGGTLAAYTPDARAALLGRIDTSYENAADEVGFVLATSVRAGKFELYRERHSGEGVDVPLDQAYESQVIQALASHDNAKLRVVGTGAYAANGSLVRFTRVERVEPADRGVDNSAFWAAIDAISASVPDDVWNTLPTDSAENHDRYMQPTARAT